MEHCHGEPGTLLLQYFLWVRFHSCHPTNRVKALRHEPSRCAYSALTLLLVISNDMDISSYNTDSAPCTYVGMNLPTRYSTTQMGKAFIT